METKLEMEKLHSIAVYNKLNQLNVELNEISIKITDNTGNYNAPKYYLKVTDINFNQTNNSRPNHFINMRNAIVEIISNTELPDYDTTKLYKYFTGKISINFNFFNESMSAWEPFVEPWTIRFENRQVSTMTRSKLNIESDQMINVNMSHMFLCNLLLVYNKIFNQNEISWKNQISDFGGQKVDKVELFLDNNTGLDVNLYFDVAKDKIFHIPKGKSLELSESQLEEYGLKAHKDDDEEITFLRNKFSFSVDGYKYVTGINYSYNYYRFYQCTPNKKTSSFHNRQQENISYQKFITVLLKIKNSGAIKDIVLESNVRLYNNCDFNLNLWNINNSEKSLSSARHVDRLELRPQMQYQLPIPWIVSNNKIIGSLNEDDRRSIVIEELDDIHKLKEEYEHLKNEFRDLKIDFKEAKKKEKEFAERYSKTVIIQSNSVYMKLSIDLLLLRPANSITIDNNYLFVFIINPPLIFQNFIPYPLNFFIEGQNNLINPLLKANLFSFDFNDKKDLQLKLSYFENTIFASNCFKIDEEIIKRTHSKKIVIRNEEDEKDYFNIVIKYEDIPFDSIVNKHFLQNEVYIPKSKFIAIYSEYLIINKMDTRLYHVTEEAKSDNPEYYFASKTFFYDKVNLLSLENESDGIYIKTRESVWSDKIKIYEYGVDRQRSK